MYDFAMLILLCVAAVECATRFKLNDMVKAVFVALAKSKKTILSKRVSDHWKEVAIPFYARNMLLGSLQLTLFFAGFSFLFFLSWKLSPSLLQATLSLQGIVVSIVSAFLFYRLRKLKL